MATIRLSDAKLNLSTSLLDCGRKAITKDMRKTLQSDKYPNIILELKEIQIHAATILNFAMNGSICKLLLISH